MELSQGFYVHRVYICFAAAISRFTRTLVAGDGLAAASTDETRATLKTK
jgi:hypothetical protein